MKRYSISKKILFAVNGNGLGHATRSLPLIKRLVEDNHNIFVMGCGRAYDFLKKELGGSVEYIRGNNYSTTGHYRFSRKINNLFFIFFIPSLITQYLGERKLVKALDKKHNFDIFISDGTFGCFCRRRPSYIIHHHFRAYIPGPLSGLTASLTELFFFLFKRNITLYLIPDTAKTPISGCMARKFRFLKKKDYSYLGILSMLSKKKVRKDIDYFFSISGPEPQRTHFEKLVLEKIQDLEGRAVVALGKPESDDVRRVKNAVIYSYLDKKNQEEMMNRAKLVICRPSYSTMMDLAELDKRALLVPTPGKAENISIASDSMDKKIFYSAEQDNLKFHEDLKKAASYPGYRLKKKTTSSLENFIRILFSGKA